MFCGAKTHTYHKVVLAGTDALPYCKSDKHLSKQQNSFSTELQQHLQTEIAYIKNAGAFKGLYFFVFCQSYCLFR
jgi:hypothetical protein